MKLSIIIPVYNGEKYISELLDNILDQIDNHECEILVIENGSSDNTTELLMNNYYNNSKVKLFHSEKGVSKARNLGIREATGDYLMFIDADDKLLNNSINHILKDIKTNRDLYIYSFIKGKKETKDTECEKIELYYESAQTDDYIDWIMAKPTLRASAWSKVFKKNIINDNKIYFNESLRFSEDSEFLLRYLKYVNSITVSRKCIYKYILSPNSSMRTKNSDRIQQYIESMKCSINEYKETKHMQSLYLYILTNFNILLVHDVFVYNNGEHFFEKVKLFKKIFKNSIFESALKNTSIINFFCKELIVEFFLKLKLNIFAYLLCCLKSYINQK